MPEVPAQPELQSDDVLLGGEEIHSFITELLGRTQSLSATYYWVRRGWIPTAKVGSHLLASKTAIRQRFAADAGLAA